MHPNPEVRKLQRVVSSLLSDHKEVSVLEAGCGSFRHITYEGEAFITGIDLSSDQLLRNQNLDRRISGDIQVYPFPPESFDVVVCWDVLEHLPRPQEALGHLISALKEDGLLIIGVPNVLSVKGLITKLTPFAFHVWFHQHVFKNETAGLPGHNPFPTFLRFSIAPDRLVKLGVGRGLVVEYRRLYENDTQVALRNRLKIVGWSWRALRQAVAVAGLGLISLNGTESHIVMRKASEKRSQLPRSNTLSASLA